MADQEGLIALLEDAGIELPTDLPVPLQSVSKKDVAESADKDWQTDPVPVKWDKIRSAFYNGKTAYEVETAAGDMPVQSWLELASKMAPKTVEINSMQITAVRIELPPVGGYDTGDIIDVEIPE